MTPSLAVLGLPPWVDANLPWIIAGLIVVIGLFVIGIKDVVRFSITRAWAISGVSFSESIRRRVLLITPLAILGIIIVSQLQKPLDEADAIRQTIKVAMFATGMVVCIVTIILACTNLPKEIDNRVIYTVVTKPTTRLEIVVGKVIGFARVSATVLLIMGLASWFYIAGRAWYMQRNVAARLDAGEVAPIHRETLQHYRDKGLLAAKQYETPASLQVYSHLPQGPAAPRWVFGSSEQDILVPFSIGAGDIAPATAGDGSADLALVANLQVQQRRLTPSEKQESGDELSGIPAVTPEEGAGPVNPAYTNTASDAPAPRVSFQILDRNLYTVISSQQINGGKSVAVPTEPGPHRIAVRLTPDLAKKLIEPPLGGKFFVQVLPLTVATQYGVTVPETFTPQTNPDELPMYLALANPAGVQVIPPSIAEPNKWAGVLFRGRTGNFGQQLKGGPEQTTPVGVYTFRNARVPSGDAVQFELRSGVERSGDNASESDDLTDVTVQVLDKSMKPVGDPVKIHPESLRTAYFDVKPELLGDGNFSVALRSQTPGHWVGLNPSSLQLVVASNSFAYNLFKSLLILWLMSVLVVVVSVFCSTFLSWPIAIVLTVVILLGRWGVEQLGDATGSGIGNQVATDLGFSDPNKAKVVSTTVEGLSKMLNTVAAVLPDISRFEASEDVERGITLPKERVFEALGVVGGFGIPLLVLSYIFLRNKEVAP